MPPKRDKKDRKGSTEADDMNKPQPPNIFLYIQLAGIGQLPTTINPLELHMEQGGSVIVKCVEQYNTEGIILQDEFLARPTYTLIFQQDNLDRINHAADNPLLIKLYMRKSDGISFYGEEEEMEEEKNIETMLKALLNEVDSSSQEKDDADMFNEKEELVLLCVGYLDVIKLFGHHRSMMREELFLYPVPNVPNELRSTVHSEWHLYTLVPIAKELSFNNLAFITFESIYNLKEEYSLDTSSFNVQLSFRSTTPIARNEYHVIPWCSFNGFTEDYITNQNNYLLFESFRNSIDLSYCTGLKSTMEVQLHKLFSQLMRSEDLDVDFDAISIQYDLALICNTFHRFILTLDMSNMLFNAFAWRRYVILVEAFQAVPEEKKKGAKKLSPKAPKQKIFEGILDPSIMLFPGVQTIRFAVELKYLGTKKKVVKSKRVTTINEPISQKDSRLNNVESEGATFAIIRLCLLAPLGETYNELKVFRDSFISQNRLLHCNLQPPEPSKITLSEIQRENYVRFDAFIRDTMRYIVDKNVHSVEEKRGNFCCVLQNLTNVLLKVVGSDFNMRTHTKTNAEFTNLCAVAFNELESRIHKILNKIEEEGLEELVKDRHQKVELLLDNMNTIKLLNAVGDKRMSTYFYEKEKSRGGPLFEFYDLIAKMERAEYVIAKEFFKTSKILSSNHEYFAGWIHIFLNYVDTRDDPDPTTAANANECLLNSITQYAEKYGRQLDGWILLYCYYKRFDYAPGFTYARWRLEEQLGRRQPRINEAEAPFSLWGLLLNMNPEFNTKRGTMFFKCFKMFVRLGLFEFGQVIFDEVQEQCEEVDRYLINTQLKILLNQLDEGFQPVEYGGGEDNCEEEEMSPQAAFVAQLNGNIEYHRGNLEKAASYYERIMDQSPEGDARDNYLLSKLRLAYISFEMDNFDQTINALSQSFHGNLLTLVCNYLMGKAYYKVDELNKALECFISCTRFRTHVPNIWGFLALINLQLGNNLNAINCWKYARIDPTKPITDETIFEELNLIDVDSIDLYIDVPESGSSLSSSVSSGDE
ncbi:uncharacterized protein LOC117782012 [Drosophila innubila]|uniref:uncharacterized protein LOC117782012 n=1 Tax=Drosophila innubila TaxID=198719 RepID=UPI00148CBC93|nr:uncharacterized protein LOC117782012 [Drosophila innubila]